MTLIVSLRIPDGIVLAGDSMATMNARLQAQLNININCPECGHQHTVNPRLALPPVPATTFAFAQKVFPFLNDFGVGTFGVGMLEGRTIYFLMRRLEQDLRRSGTHFADAHAAAEAIGNYLHPRLLADAEKGGVNLDKLPENWVPLGFQVVGYNVDEAISIEVKMGRDVDYVTHRGAGCTVSGQHHVVSAIWGLYKQRPNEQPAYEVFSLQDAISYAEFLINTTAMHQQFSKTVPTVGGEIDLALITPFDQFKWIRRKQLSRILEGEGELQS